VHENIEIASFSVEMILGYTEISSTVAISGEICFCICLSEFFDLLRKET
jgi:hypothetical protein